MISKPVYLFFCLLLVCGFPGCSDPAGSDISGDPADLTETQAKELAAAFFNQEVAGDTLMDICGHPGTDIVIPELTAGDWTLTEQTGGRWRLTRDCLSGCLVVIVSFKLDGTDPQIEYCDWACV